MMNKNRQNNSVDTTKEFRNGFKKYGCKRYKDVKTVKNKIDSGNLVCDQVHNQI